MADIVDSITRSRMMSGIRGQHTQPELMVRRFLHARGYRFRLHRKDLPGCPDLVLPKYRLVIFVHGCFWHRHEGCSYATSPSTRKEFWQAKLLGNSLRDRKQVEQLQGLGWRVLIVWECGLKHSADQLNELEQLITSQNNLMEWPISPSKIKPRL